MMAEPGHTLSHYRLVEKIGEGGMGVVWKAVDLVLHRTVAIKVLPADRARDEKRRQMFLEEARLASSVSDARIVQVHELGRQGDLDFIVMEYVEGRPLNRILDGRALPPEKVAGLGEQVARALSRAHRKGLLHRDLKPANILVTPDGEVKVVDFGLATLSGRPDSAISTLPGIASSPDPIGKGRAPRAGTLPYMSPEQIRGETLDPRSDIFSLGVVLYEMTTGQRPFAGATNTDLMREVLRARPVPVHERVPKVPLDLDKIIQKALSPHADERYQTMEDLAVDLRRLGRDLEAGSSTSYEEVVGPPERARRRRWRWLGATGAVLVVSLSLGVWLGRSRLRLLTASPAAHHRTVLIVPLEVRGQGEGADYVGRAFAEALAADLAPARDLKVLPVPAGDPKRLLDTPSASRSALEVGAGRLLTGALTRQGKAIHARLTLVDTVENRVLWGAEGDAADDQMPSLASSLARQAASELGAAFPRLYDSPENSPGGPEMAASPLTSEVLGALRRHDVPSALESSKRLVEAFPGEPDAHALRADVLMKAWEVHPSSSNRRSLEDGLVALELTDPKHFYCDTKRAYLLGREGRPREAIGRLTHVLTRTDLTPAVRAYVLGLRGQAERVAGQIDAALADLEQALLLDPTDPRIFQKLAETLRGVGRYAEALVRARQAVALSPSNPVNQATLGLTLVSLDRAEEALVPSRKACELSHNQALCASYALALMRAGRGAESVAVAMQAESLSEESDGMYNLACYWALSGKRAEAIRRLRRAVDLGDVDSYVARDPDLASLHGDPAFEAILAEVLRRLRPERAP